MAEETYSQRVNRVADYIRRHLDEELALDTLAKVAHFSPYHFHRIFKSVTQETVAAYTRRARLERATGLMRAAPHRTLTSVALEVGFGAPSDFSRVFRSAYGMAPSAWDRRSRLDGKVHLASELRQAENTEATFDVRLVERPACSIAYVRVRNPWSGTNLRAGYEALTRWLSRADVPWRERELLGISWESELATPLERLVYDLGIVISPELEPTEEFGLQAIPAALAAEIHCTSLPQMALAWDHFYAEWFPNSGYEPADLPAIKRFRNTPELFDADAWNADCSIAVRRRGAPVADRLVPSQES